MQPQELFRQTILQIAETAGAEKILCYGRRHFVSKTWSAANRFTGKSAQSVYDILVIVDGSCKFQDHEILDQLNKYNTSSLRFNVLVHCLTAVNKAIEQGSRFFQAICHHATLVFDKSGLPLATPEPSSSRPKDAQHWDRHFSLAKQFLQGAGFYQYSGYSPISVFMLHQAVEQASMALLYSRLGYRAVTHNLGRLLGLTENISPQLAATFHHSTRTGKTSFEQLTRAYTDVRYGENFNPSSVVAETLYYQVRELLEVIGKLHNEGQSPPTTYVETDPFEEDNLVMESVSEFVVARFLYHTRREETSLNSSNYRCS